MLHGLCFSSGDSSEKYTAAPPSDRPRPEVSDTHSDESVMRPFVRGILNVTIHEAKDLPVDETASSKISGFFKGMVGKKHKKDFHGTYAKVSVAAGKATS